MSIKHRVGHISEIPEDEGLRIEVGGHIVAVFKRGSRIFAVGDSCPHMGASLSEGYVDGNTVICPWHGWMFDLETGDSPFDEEARIPVYRINVEDGEIFVEVDPVAPGCPAKTRPEQD